MPDGNTEQIRAVAETVAKVTIAEYEREHSGIPTWTKWLGGIVATLLSGSILALGFWLFSSVSDMKVTLGRMDERLSGSQTTQSDRYDDLDRRVTRLEAYHSARQQGGM